MADVQDYIPAQPKPKCLVCACDLQGPGEHVGDGARIPCARCGTYRISGTLEATIRNGSTQVPFELSSWLRLRADAGVEPLLTSPSLAPILGSLPRFSVRQKINMVLRLIENRTPSPGAAARLHLQHDGALVWVKDEGEFDFYLRTLQERELIDPGAGGVDRGVVLSATGWDHLDDLGHNDPLATQGFIAMWFDESVRPAYDEAIAPAVTAAGFLPYRVDEDPHGERIDARITNAIEESRFVVADVTGQRASVYFEAGYALALGKPVIWTVREDDLKNAAFDTRQYPHIVWSELPKFQADLEQLIRSRVGTREREG